MSAWAASLPLSIRKARELYERAAPILGFDLAKLCFEGPAEELDSTVISQPALFVTSLAALEKLRADSPEIVLGCEIAAGLSLGEYTALVFANAMSFEDGLRVVKRRGEAMQAAADATPSGMVSILLLDRTAGRTDLPGSVRAWSDSDRQLSVSGKPGDQRRQRGL